MVRILLPKRFLLEKGTDFQKYQRGLIFPYSCVLADLDAGRVYQQLAQ